MKTGNNKVWLVAYIHRDFLHKISEELNRYGYNDVETYIPTIRVLKKKFKGKNMFEFIPLLFNYGFFKVDYENACNPEYLSELRQRISAIYTWMKDPVQNMKNTTKLKRDNSNFFDSVPSVAVAKDREISDLIRQAESIDIYSSDDLERFKPGDYIVLKGYPFENMPAELISINHNKKEVKVRLLLDMIVKEMKVSFENVFYTVYQGHDDSISGDDNYDEISSKSNNSNKIDKMLFKNLNYKEDEFL